MVMKVSVVIPTYNQAQYITESIQSALNQTFQDFELIVVDDGSKDNTREVVDSFKDPRIRYLYQENQGVSGALNTGIMASTGEYFAGLASDDIWLPQNLELKVKLLDSRPDIAFALSDMYVFDSDTGTTLDRLWKDVSERYIHELQDGTRKPLNEYLSRGVALFAIPTVIIRRKVFDEVGYFDESLSTEDYDMFIRVLQRFPIGIINEPLVRYRVHRASLSRSNIAYPGTLAAINKIINNYSLSREHIKLIRRNKLARTHFDYGCEKIIAGEIALGRRALLAAIRANPWWFRSYLYLVFSLLGRRLIWKIKSWKKGLGSGSL